MRKKILIVEDDVIIREELYTLLVNGNYEVMALKDFNQTAEEILKLNPDLVLLDMNLPYVNGDTVLKEVRKKSMVPIIMLTSRTGEMDEALSITYGADDYITKPYSPLILLLRIQNLFKRVSQSSDDLSYRDLVVSPSKGILSKGNQQLYLTKNEMIIFMQLLHNCHRIVTRDELMTDLWNHEEYINDNALTVNISRLRSKLNNFGYENVIETRKGQGYILI